MVWLELPRISKQDLTTRLSELGLIRSLQHIWRSLSFAPEIGPPIKGMQQSKATEFGAVPLLVQGTAPFSGSIPCQASRLRPVVAHLCSQHWIPPHQALRHPVAVRIIGLRSRQLGFLTGPWMYSESSIRHDQLHDAESLEFLLGFHKD